MPELSRRAFLIGGSVGAAAVAVASAIPSLPTVVGTAEADAPAAQDETAVLAGAELPSAGQPLVAHVTDLRSGAISLFVGEQEFTMRDPRLAGRLFAAAK